MPARVPSFPCAEDRPICSICERRYADPSTGYPLCRPCIATAKANARQVNEAMRDPGPSPR